MSATYVLQVDTGGAEPVEVDDYTITYNLGTMLRAAGFPRWDALRGAPAVETAGMLDGVARRLRADPEAFREHNPPNGWGSYESCLDWVERFRDACARHPATTIWAYL